MNIILAFTLRIYVTKKSVKNLRNFQKPLDKAIGMCYNIIAVERDRRLGSKKRRPTSRSGEIGRRPGLKIP